MKKIVPLAIIGAAVGAAGYLFNRSNKEHVEKTIQTLDELSKTAEETVSEFANELSQDNDNGSL